MKKPLTRQHNISALAGLLLLGVFAVCILSVLLSGAGAYRRLTARNNAAMEQRSRLQYVATRLRQTEGSVRIDRFGDGDALLLSETVGQARYLTRIYCHEGWLMELYTAADSPVDPGDGEKLIAAETMELEAEGSLLTVRLSGRDGDSQELLLRAAGGVAP